MVGDQTLDYFFFLVFSIRSLYYLGPQVHQGSDFQTLLSEGVQGRVDFEVRGPRLNNSKTEKASQLYGKDHRLHWRVTAAMPKVVVSKGREEYGHSLGECQSDS